MEKQAILAIFKHKRADQNMMMKMATELLLASLVVIIFVFMFRNVRDDTQFEAEYVSRDLALLTSLVGMSPYKASISYTQDQVDLTKYTIDLKDNTANLRINEKDYYFPYYLNGNLGREISTASDSAQVVVTNNRKVFYSGDRATGLSEKYCPLIETGRQRNILVIDPGIVGNTASEREKKDNSANEYLHDLSTAIQISPKNKFKTTIMTRGNNEASISERTAKIDPNTDVLVSLITHDSNNPLDYTVRAYVPAQGGELSMKLACNILQEIENSFDCDIRTETVFTDGEFRIVSNDRFASGVVLEIGQFDRNGNCLLANIPAMSEAIINGIDEYYS